MASDYRVSSAGHDIALGSLTILDPQPKSEGVQITQRSYAPTAVYDQGLYLEMVWELAEEATDLAAILTAFGLVAATENEVTIYAPRFGVYTRYNGLAIQPEVVHRDYFFKNVVVLIKNLELSA